ncbi:MAG: hypothetical protein HOJ48_12250 [Desulfobacula sp.]|nr:hypothetical protein [Desulfobacula sp.]
MKKSISILGIIIVLLTGVPALSEENDATATTMATKNYIATDKKWAVVNANVSAIRMEMERLRNLRWDLKIILNVIENGVDFIQEKTSLSSAQRMALNARIPLNRGRIYKNDMIITDILGAVPLNFVDAKMMITKLLNRIEDTIQKNEKELKIKEKESYQLSRELSNLERSVESEFKESGTATPWEKGLPRITDKELYDRYAQKERLRQEEVDSRRQYDLERLWYKNSYPTGVYSQFGDGTGFFPNNSDYRPNALLVELRGLDKRATCRQCYPFSSSMERQWILNQLNQAARDKEKMPCVGDIDSFRVLNNFTSMNLCFQQLY